MRYGEFFISEGNSKMGNVPSFNLTPGRTCTAEACKTCLKEGCYAIKLYKLRPSVRKCYDRNTAAVLNDLEGFKASINSFLKTYKPRIFRIHSSGDFVTEDYFLAWLDIAKSNKDVVFLAFTKCYAMIKAHRNEIPENMRIIFSAWPGMPIERADGIPVAWVDDGKENRIPADALECSGKCEDCAACWITEKDVYFRKH